MSAAALEKTITVPAEADPAPQPPEEVPAASANGSGRAAIIAELRAAVNAYADNMIAARRLTTGYDKVRNHTLCSTGTQEFMARGHLRPPGERVDIAREDEKIRDKMEVLLRDDAWSIIGGPHTFDDYTVTGLRKRLELLRKKHSEWQDEFRKLIIQYTRNGNITPAKRDSALADLGFPPYVEECRLAIIMNGSWIFPSTPRQTPAAQAAGLQDRIIQAIIKEFGTELGEEKALKRLFHAEGSKL